MSWKDYLRDEMTPQKERELSNLNSSVNSIINTKTHWEHWQAIYQGIQGECRINLEDRLEIKKIEFTAGTHQSVWQASQSYILGSVVRPTIPNGYVYEMTLPNPGPGVSGTEEPTWPVTPEETIVDNEITWTCKIPSIDIEYGGNYNVINIFDWSIQDNPGNVIIYQYEGIGWDSDVIIVKAVGDWAIMYPLLTNITWGTNGMISRLLSALSIITTWRDAIDLRNPILEDYD